MAFGKYGIIGKMLLRLRRRFYGAVLVADVFKKRRSETVLISYISYPLWVRRGAHTNLEECKILCEVFDELGFSVDLVDSNYHRDIVKEYTIVCGHGSVYNRYINKAKCLIYYGTGVPGVLQNNNSDKIREKALSLGFNIQEANLRRVDVDNSQMISKSNLVLALGNLSNKCEYEVYSTNVTNIRFPFPNLFWRLPRAALVMPDNRSSFLFYAGSGLIHKGIAQVMVCAHRFKHNDFYVACPKEEYNQFVLRNKDLIPNNIHYLGFLSFVEDNASMLPENIRFILSPSASEGGAPSVIAATYKYRLLPIVSKQSMCDLPEKEEFDFTDMDGLVRLISNIDYSEVVGRVLRNEDYIKFKYNYLAVRGEIKEKIQNVVSF